VKPLIFVALGGAIGSLARYELTGWVLHRTVTWRFPAGTFVVNVIGCLVAGLLAGLGARGDWLSADARLFLFTGLLGGFTTFSAFGLETVLLLKRGEWLIAGGNVLLSVLIGIGAMWLVFASASRQ
jgi:fluoride exporter